MYFLRLDPLKVLLVRDGLSERQRFLYLLCQAFLYSLTIGSNETMSPPAKGLVMIITLLGVAYAYHRNGGAAGRGLLDRYISVSLVVNLRVLIVLIILSALLHIPQQLGLMESFEEGLGAWFGLFGGNGVSGLWDLLTLGAEGWVAWSVARHIGEVRLAADGGAPLAGAPAAPLLASAAAPARTSSADLDRFVETVTQRELADRMAPRRAAGRRSPTRPARVRLIRAKRRRRQ